MNTHPTIQALADAIYAIRRTPNAAFEPAYALYQVAASGAHVAAKALSIAANRYDQGLVPCVNQSLWERITPTCFSGAVNDRVFEAFCLATAAHAPFVDLLGLANRRLIKQYQVGLPGYFLNSEERNDAGILAHVVTAFGQPSIAMLDNRAGSQALASLAGLHRASKLLIQNKTALDLGCYDSRALLLAVMQVGLAMTHFPHYIERVEFMLIDDETCESLFKVSRKCDIREAA